MLTLDHDPKSIMLATNLPMSWVVTKLALAEPSPGTAAHRRSMFSTFTHG